MTRLKHFLQYIISLFLGQRERFVMWIPVFMGLGIGAYFSLPFEPALWSSATVLMCLAVLLSVTRRVTSINRFEFVVFFILLGFTAAAFKAYVVNAPMLEKSTGIVEVIGNIEKIETLPEKKSIRVLLNQVAIENIKKQDSPKKIRIQLYNKAVSESIDIGDTISVKAILKPPSPPVMTGAFDFRRYMFFQQIGATGFAVGKVKILLKANNQTKLKEFNKFWEKQRQNIKQIVHKNITDNRIASLIIALLTGDRGEISKDTWENIRTAGLAHLLAISGLHIGLVAGLIFFVIRACLALSETITLRFSIKKISAFFAILGTLFYLFLVGMPVSAQRATIMTVIVLFAVLIDREAISLRLAAIAAIIILLVSPEALLSAGFHMSFAAVVALIAFYEAIANKWQEWYKNSSLFHRLMLYLFASILTTIIASLATAPFSLYHFGQVADEMSLLANILAVPLTAFLVMPAALLALILMPIGLEHYPLQLMANAVEIIYNVAQDIANKGEHMIYSPAWSLTSLLFMVFGGLWLAIWQYKLRLVGLVFIVVGILLAINSSKDMQPDIYIAGSGKLAAIRADKDILALSSLKREKFIAENWLKRIGKNKIKLVSWDNVEAAKNGISCDFKACTWYRGDKKIIFVNNPIVFLKNCDSKNTIMIAMQDVIPNNCNTLISIDRFDLRREGTHVIYFGYDKENMNEFRVKTVASSTGSRYWTPKYFQGF